MNFDQINEYRFLQSVYDSKESTIQVVYGSTYVSIEQVLNTFFKDKKWLHYKARSVSERIQTHLWGREIAARGVAIAEYPGYHEIFEALGTGADKPLALVIGDFEKMVRSSPSFMKELTEFVYDESHPHVMALLISQNVEWVENRMVDALGEDARELGGIVKIRELAFAALREHFTGMSYEDAVLTYSLMGGKSRLWHYFDADQSFRTNLCRNYLNMDSYLFSIPVHILKENLRETEVYNTILFELAAGNNKLNDLYHTTGYSRAKIMVYLKNLISLEMVEKIYSFSGGGRDDVQKGIYRISDQMVHFYFKFIFPHLSSLHHKEPEQFYDLYIGPGIQEYAEEYFREICRQYILRCDELGRLPIHIEEESEWVGKQGRIDIVAQSEEGETILGLCSWRERMGVELYDWLLSCARRARLKSSYIYLFGARGFSEDLLAMAAADTRILLLGLNELQV